MRQLLSSRRCMAENLIGHLSAFYKSALDLSVEEANLHL